MHSSRLETDDAKDEEVVEEEDVSVQVVEVLLDEAVGGGVRNTTLDPLPSNEASVLEPPTDAMSMNGCCAMVIIACSCCCGCCCCYSFCRFRLRDWQFSFAGRADGRWNPFGWNLAVQGVSDNLVNSDAPVVAGAAVSVVSDFFKSLASTT